MGLAAVERVPGPLDPLSLASLPHLRCPQVLTVQGWRVALADPLAAVTDADRLDELGERCGWRDAREEGAPPFTGGAAGYLSDDCAPAFVDLPAVADRRPVTAPLPPLWLGVYDAAVCVPPGGQEAYLVASDLPGFSPRPAGERLDHLRRQVHAARARTTDEAPRATAGPAALSLPAPAHATAVERILGWIAAGDLYQLNLTLHVSVDWAAGGLALARRLERASPGAAHAAYLRLPGGTEVVSVSPETFLHSDGRTARTRPVKGTRARDDDPGRDVAAARSLQTSAKDRAEHVMIVDLERNDLGRVCRPGSVRVPELATLEAHPTVWHLTSTVQGRLRDEVGLGGLLAAMFPSGSVTGTPKRMAVARTRLVEPVRRGVYCGAIGVVSRGLVDLSVAIRTAVVHDGRASYGTGGAIVADSDPREEFDEAMAKAAAFRHAVDRMR